MHEGSDLFRFFFSLHAIPYTLLYRNKNYCGHLLPHSTLSSRLYLVVTPHLRQFNVINERGRDKWYHLTLDFP